MDNMDRILFEIAQEQTAAMDFDHAFEQITAIQEKRKQKTLKRRRFYMNCAAVAASLLIGAFGGVISYQAGYLNFLHPYHIVVDPPKTDDGDFLPHEVEVPAPIAMVEVPKTSGENHSWYEDDTFFSDMPYSTDIRAFLPQWLPDGFGPLDVSHYDILRFYSRDLMQSERSINGELIQTDGGVAQASQGLEIGEGRPLMIEPVLDGEGLTIIWTIKVTEQHCLEIVFQNLSFEETLQVLHSVR